MTHVEEGRDVSDLVTPPQQQIVRDTATALAGTSTGSNGIPLYHYQDLPPFLQGNPYITSGYRAYLPTEMCIQRCDGDLIFFCSNTSQCGLYSVHLYHMIL